MLRSRLLLPHADTHRHGGTDEIATATAATNAIPKAASTGKLDIGWFPTGDTASTLCVGNDPRLSDSRPPNGPAGGDLAGSFPAPTVSQARGLRETSGPTTLAMAALADGELLQRQNAAIGGMPVPLDICEGRLTLTSNTPITSADVTGANTLFFTPFKGNRVALFDGSRWKLHTFSELSLSLSVTAGKNYDVFLYDNAGTPALELSAAWTNNTTRSEPLAWQDGVRVKSADNTRRYLGTIRASGTNTTEDSAVFRGVANWCQAVPRTLKKREHSATSSWTSTNTAFHPWNSDSNNKVSAVVLTGRPVQLWFEGGFNMTSGPAATPELGIGLDSASVDSKTTGGRADAHSDRTAQYLCTFSDYPAEGYHDFFLLEKTSVSSPATRFFGESGRCGLIGTIAG
ncbi:MAG: hypothetical protein KatS3mg105_1251 [Gemmatales bacterium]|nr:MAG: hypothetical protein KatS3mg105_1251 [Gemmatales bacterium]